MKTQFPNKAAQPMPGNVKGALAKAKLLETFQERPQYQQTDYLKWIALAAGPQQKTQRIEQLVDELTKGNVFKGEPWTAPAETKPSSGKSAKVDSPVPTKASRAKVNPKVAKSAR